MPGWVIGSSTSFVGEGEVGAGESANQSITDSDSGSLAEGPAIALGHTESGGLGEGQELALAILDTGTLAETPAIALGDTDGGAAGETGSASEALDAAATDDGTLAEAGAVSVTYPAEPAQPVPHFGAGPGRRPADEPRRLRVNRGADWAELGERAQVVRRVIVRPPAPYDEEAEDMALIVAAIEELALV